jgi:AraC family transcriptional regulator of adaptative response/methylated-DNA-[protein]-cysteine methyltransferase
LRKNVAFHDSREAAEAAGFRPCMRCKPDQPPLAERQAAIVAQACRLIDEAEEAPDLDSLAEAVGVSRFYFHRMFKAVAGITPKAYANAARARRVQAGLVAQATVTDAMYAAGFNSSGRFYAQSPAVLGMKPSTFRAGGAGEQIKFAIAECSLGPILVASTEQGICAILIDDDPDFLVKDLQDRFPKAELIGAEPAYEQVVSRVVGMVEQPSLGLDLPLDVRGTAFQQRVWQVLRAIPAGKRVTYAELAELADVPRGARAVASACAANAIAVAIPCHRVVRNDGSISGYRWGVDRKAELLNREAISECRQWRTRFRRSAGRPQASRRAAGAACAARASPSRPARNRRPCRPGSCPRGGAAGGWGGGGDCGACGGAGLAGHRR